MEQVASLISIPGSKPAGRQNVVIRVEQEIAAENYLNYSTSTSSLWAR
jgi:hypothetical protein